MFGGASHSISSSIMLIDALDSTSFSIVNSASIAKEIKGQ